MRILKKAASCRCDCGIKRRYVLCSKTQKQNNTSHADVDVLKRVHGVVDGLWTGSNRYAGTAESF